MDADLTYFDPFLEKRLDGLDAMKEFLKPFTGKIKVDRFDMLNPKVQRDGEAHFVRFASQAGLHFLLEPFIKHIVKIDVGQQRS